MQKVMLWCVVVAVLSVAGCVESASPHAASVSAERIVKLRGYDFDEKGFFAAAHRKLIRSHIH